MMDDETALLDVLEQELKIIQSNMRIEKARERVWKWKDEEENEKQLIV